MLDNIWSRQRGLFVRVRLPTGQISPMGWLLLFPDVHARDCMLQGRVAHHTCEVLWDSRCPRTLTFLRGLHLIHVESVRQRWGPRKRQLPDPACSEGGCAYHAASLY
jgi:hypothetical protein